MTTSPEVEPAPESTPPRKPRKRRGLPLAWAISLVIVPALLLAASVVFDTSTGKQVAVARSAVHAAQADADQRAAAAAAALQVKQAADAAAAAQKAQDQLMKTQGYSRASNDLYYRFAPNKDFTCGSQPCIGVWVYTFAACPAGVYIAASIMEGGSSVGFTNKITGGLSAHGSASALLENYLGYGNSFKLTDVHCMG